MCVCVYCGSYLQAVAHTCIMRKINHYLMKLMASCFVCLLACRCVPIVPIVYNQLPPVCFCLCLFLCVLSLALVIVRRIYFIVNLYSFCSLICVLYLFSFKSVFIVTITRDGLAMHHYYKYCISLYSCYCVSMPSPPVSQSDCKVLLLADYKDKKNK